MLFVPRAWLSCLILGIALIGCANGSRSKVASVKRVFIEKSHQTSNQTAEMITPTAFESAAIELTRHGYVVVSSKNSAEGVLRMSWQVAPSSNSSSADNPMSLSMTLFNKQGQRIFSGNSGPAVPVAFWNQTRAHAEVASILSRMPTAVAAVE